MSFRSRLGDAVAPSETLRRDSQPSSAIPDSDTAGVSDTIAVAEAQTIAGIAVGVDITHPYRGDLRVTLTTPWGVTVELHPKKNEGGSDDDLKVTYDETALPALSTLHGRSTQGAWRLAVQDLAPADIGRLNRWWIEFATGTPDPAQPVRLEEAPGIMIPDAPSAGIERTLATAEFGQVLSVEVGVDISHTYIGDLRVRLRSPAGTEVVLHDRAGGAGDNIARTYTAASTPALAGLAGKQIAGPWTLLVSDHEAVDVGKLNRWSLTIRRA